MSRSESKALIIKKNTGFKGRRVIPTSRIRARNIWVDSILKLSEKTVSKRRG